RPKKARNAALAGIGLVFEPILGNSPGVIRKSLNLSDNVCSIRNRQHSTILGRNKSACFPRFLFGREPAMQTP
ncbi:hypothetical protein, partial [Acidocella sp. MX-AZ02]|uniref:hypothetical protein n=1 Tax=Acidocella sp. MX-AZ02 TaxID=1214225 RepID=UPI001969D5FE